MTLRVAMWSGPRNISTAMMRSWENRPDCRVIDEPFYAYYLSKTRSPHPYFEAVLAAQSQEFEVVARQLTEGSIDLPIYYQKHMTHHMLPEVPLNWTKGLLHCFLIRDPAQIVQSYTNSRGLCSAEDIGIIRQAELYDAISEITGKQIPIIDANDVLDDPRRILTLLCEHLGIPFYETMLQWPPGPRDSDGVWAPHWYHSVNESTGFSAPSKSQNDLNDSQRAVVEKVLPSYRYLAARKLK